MPVNTQVPAAYFCALGPHAYAITAAGKTYDNTAPRDFKERLTTATHLNDTVRPPMVTTQASAGKHSGSQALYDLQ